MNFMKFSNFLEPGLPTFILQAISKKEQPLDEIKNMMIIKVYSLSFNNLKKNYC